MKPFSKLFFLCIIISSIYGCNSNEQKKDATLQTQKEPKGNDSTAVEKNKKLTYEQAYDKALSLWNIPFEEIDLSTHLGPAHIIISGPKDAEPLVLLHGMNASSTMWYPNIKSFSEQHRVYAIDFLLEPGKSTCSSELNNTQQIVNWYYEIFDQLKLKKFSIVGASRGGWVAINIALHSQSRINKLVLLSPAQTFTWIKPGMEVISNINYSLSPKRKKLRSILETMTFNVDNIKQEYINQYFIATEKATMSKCILQMTPFSDKQLRSLKIPTLVLIGDNDIINDHSSLKQAKKMIPHVETEIIKKAGHFLSFDQPEIINKRIVDFLKGEKIVVKK